MSDHCPRCLNRGRIETDNPHSYDPRARIGRLCDCQPAAPRSAPRMSDDILLFGPIPHWEDSRPTHEEAQELLAHALDFYRAAGWEPVSHPAFVTRCSETTVMQQFRRMN